MQHLFKLHGLSRILKTQFPAGMAIVLGAKDFANRLDNKKVLREACLIIVMCNQQYQLLRLDCDTQRFSIVCFQLSLGGGHRPAGVAEQQLQYLPGAERRKVYGIAGEPLNGIVYHRRLQPARFEDT